MQRRSRSFSKRPSLSAQQQPVRVAVNGTGGGGGGGVGVGVSAYGSAMKGRPTASSVLTPAHHHHHQPSLSSRKVMSGSRIPTFGQGQMKGRSSSHSTSRPKPNLMTPATAAASGLQGSSSSRSRSLSSSRTPMRVLQPKSPNISDARLSGRGSVGAKTAKDSRKLHDKDWQGRTVREIIDFLLSQGHMAIPLSSFPLNTTDFRNVFEFIVDFVVPGFKLPKQRFDTEVPHLLKKLGYSIQVTKSSFQTLGTMHSWPHVLGALHYVVCYAKKLCHLNDNFLPWCYPSVDEHGFQIDMTSDDYIMFKTLAKAYHRFNIGASGFDEEIKEYKRELESNHSTDTEEIRRLQAREREQQAELKELTKATNPYNELAERNKDLQSDLQSYKEYAEQKRNYCSRKRAEVEKLKQKISAKESRMNSLESTVRELRSVCMSRGVDHNDLTQIEMREQSFAEQIELLTKKKREYDEARWEKEIEHGKVVDFLDGFIRKYNDKLTGLDFDVETENFLLLDLATNIPESMQQSLQELLLHKEEEVRKLSQESKALRHELGKLQGAVKSKEQNVQDMERSAEVKVKELDDINSRLQLEDAKYTEDINKQNAELLELNRGEAQSAIRTLQDEVAKEEAKVAEREAQIQTKFEEWKNKFAHSLQYASNFLENKCRENEERFKELKKRKAQDDEENSKLLAERNRIREQLEAFKLELLGQKSDVV